MRPLTLRALTALAALSLSCALLPGGARPQDGAAATTASMAPHPDPLPAETAGRGSTSTPPAADAAGRGSTPAPPSADAAGSGSAAGSALAPSPRGGERAGGEGPRGTPDRPGPTPADAVGSGTDQAPPAARPPLLPPGLHDNLPPPLPPPDPAPDLTPAPAAVRHADPLDVLWGHRLDFGAGGQPLVTIRIMEGQREVALRTLAPARLGAGGATVDLPAGTRLLFAVQDGRPARLDHAPLLAEAAWRDRRSLDAARQDWAARGVRTRSRIVGGVYGIAGRVVDNRRELLLAEGDRSQAGAQALAEDLMRRFGQRVPLHAEPVARPRGRIVITGPAGPAGDAEGVAVLEPAGDGQVAVEAVAHGLDGKAAREDRRYRGRLLVTVDAGGALAVVDALPLEALLRGLVPSEMPAGSAMEALKAQAVTARSNVLAQIGTRHLGDPYVLCAEVHCQAYRGTGAETARTDEAVRATAGEALFGRANRTLVDGVYSAMCGGHGEDADAVWGGAPDPSLRGQPDLPAEFSGLWSGGLRDEARLRVFLADPPDAFCRRPAAATRNRFRWERRLPQAELDALTASLGVGAVRGLAVLERGVSGRALALRVEGARGAADVRGELAIRRLLRNLPSSMFVVDREGDDWLLHGGGWGHGAGMCQWGAIGRAEAGQGYREILGASFAGAEVVKIY